MTSKSNIAELFYASPILVPIHDHPVFHCLHDNTFNCEFCKTAFNIGYNEINPMGSFYCTLCDTDICDNCFGEIELYKIVFYDSTLVEKKEKEEIINTQDFSDRGWIKFDCHIHSLPRIIKGNDHFGWDYQCSKCEKQYVTYVPENQENVYFSKELYYCAICNYCLCIECSEKYLNNRK